MSAIEVKNLVKQFHGQTVLHGIDLDVAQGKWWLSLGPADPVKPRYCAVSISWSSLKAVRFGWVT
jgi:ABC-type lipopolysaccharide export system ATPase subunit